MLALEAGKRTLDVAEFLLDYCDSLIDKIGIVDRNLVLVPDSLLVVFIHQGIQDIPRPLAGRILEGKREDGSTLVALAYPEPAEET